MPQGPNFSVHVHVCITTHELIISSSPQDTAGEERYASLSSFYCRGANVAILAFDLTSRSSLTKLQEVFIPLLEDSAGTCLTVVVGTKLDLAKQERQVENFVIAGNLVLQMFIHDEMRCRVRGQIILQENEGIFKGWPVRLVFASMHAMRQ